MLDVFDESYSESGFVVCAKCGTKLDFDLWLIIDAEARPDLLARLVTSTLNVLTCKNCLDRGRVDKPLFVIFPNKKPPHPLAQTIIIPAKGDGPTLKEAFIDSGVIINLVDIRGDDYVSHLLAPPNATMRPKTLKNNLSEWYNSLNSGTDAEHLRKKAIKQFEKRMEANKGRINDPYYVDRMTGYNIAAWANLGYETALNLMVFSPPNQNETIQNYHDRMVQHFNRLKKEFYDDPADQDGGAVGVITDLIALWQSILSEAQQ